jgi:hypothetical protein
MLFDVYTANPVSLALELFCQVASDKAPLPHIPVLFSFETPELQTYAFLIQSSFAPDQAQPGAQTVPGTGSV